MPELTPAHREVLDCLRAEGERLFGNCDVRLGVQTIDERETATVLKLAVDGAGGVEKVFVKIFKPRGPAHADLVDARERILRDFEVASRVYASPLQAAGCAVARPLACFPDRLAIVTAEARGETLSSLLERRAAWWPAAEAQRDLAAVLCQVGRWLRTFQTVARPTEPFSLPDMREYIDVRLRRLLATAPPTIDEGVRRRTLGFFDRTASQVAAADLVSVLTHSDLAPSNVLVEGRSITVIDFAMAAPGGLFMDVARLFTQLEFLTAKPKFRPAVVRALQRSLLEGFDAELQPERPLFQLFVLQHLLCHMSSLARNPAPVLARFYNRHQLRLRQRWLQSFAA